MVVFARPVPSVWDARLCNCQPPHCLAPSRLYSAEHPRVRTSTLHSSGTEVLGRLSASMTAEAVLERTVSSTLGELRHQNRCAILKAYIWCKLSRKNPERECGSRVKGSKLLFPYSGAFIPFIMAGDPDLETTEKALYALDEAGADIIELGIPYSDPLADGPTIQAASTRGLVSGTTLEKVISLVARVSSELRCPIVLFQYYNPILRKGPDEYCRIAKEAGAAGILVPDLCLEETAVMRAATKRAGLELTLLVTPTTPQARMKQIAEASEGFVYLVSVTGVTGGRTANQARVQQLIKLLREVTADDKSVAVGFGVSGPAQAEELRGWGAEGVIVGSALVKALGEASSPKEGLEQLSSLAKQLRQAIS